MATKKAVTEAKVAGDDRLRMVSSLRMRWAPIFTLAFERLGFAAPSIPKTSGKGTSFLQFGSTALWYFRRTLRLAERRRLQLSMSRRM
jgi:hypothetical protein